MKPTKFEPFGAFIFHNTGSSSIQSSPSAVKAPHPYPYHPHPQHWDLVQSNICDPWVWHFWSFDGSTGKHTALNISCIQPQFTILLTDVTNVRHMGCSKQKSLFLQMWSSPSLVKSSESLHRKIVTALPLLRKLDYFTLAREAIIRSPLSSSTSLLEYIFQSCCTMKSERWISQPTLHYEHKVYMRRYQKSVF